MARLPWVDPSLQTAGIAGTGGTEPSAGPPACGRGAAGDKWKAVLSEGRDIPVVAARVTWLAADDLFLPEILSTLQLVLSLLFWEMPL